MPKFLLTHSMGVEYNTMDYECVALTPIEAITMCKEANPGTKVISIRNLTTEAIMAKPPEPVPFKPVTVAELIEYLKTFNPDTPVAYDKYSEQAALELRDIEIRNLCEVRPDGWVANERPDKPTIPYLVFPGN